MDMEEEMLEEHLDEEYQNSEIEEDFAEFHTKIVNLEQKQLNANINREFQEKLEKAIALLRLHVQSYQRIIILNRRRAKQRLRRKQSTLRNFFLQSLMEMQIRFAETLPIAVNPEVILKSKSKHLGENKSNEKGNEAVPNLNYYLDVVSKFTNDQWLDTFHIPKHVFDLLCNRLKTSLGDINMHFETWIAMCMYMFATGIKFSSVAMLFNVDSELARQSLFKFTASLLKEFSENIPSMPKTKTELEIISKAFQRASNMTPCVAGVLCLFEVPNFCKCGSFSTCGSKDIKVQICIDHRLLFRKVETTTENPTMFLKSPNEISHNWKKFSDNCVVPYFIVAPPGYPLRTWLMQKYDNPRESWEYEFNKCFGNLNIFREVSLKRLFGRWQILNTRECILPESKSSIVEACCLLHNLLEESGEYFSVEWCKYFDSRKNESEITAEVTKFYKESEPAIEKRNNIAKLIGIIKVHNIEDEFKEN